MTFDFRRPCAAAAFICAIIAAVPRAHAAKMPPAGPASHSGCLPTYYTVSALPLRPAAINAAGQVAGMTADHRAALWSRRDGVRLPPVPAEYVNSEAVAINAAGHAVVVAHDRTFSHHASFLFAKGVLTPLAGLQAHAYGISDSDEVVGESLVTGKETMEPVSWSGGEPRSLGGCCGGSAKAVNRRGDVIGDLYDSKGQYHAFLWTSALGLRPIGPPDRFSSAIAVNDAGDAVIQAFTQVWLYTADGLARLELSPRYPNQPHGINGCGAIVGAFGPFSDANRAFIWTKSGGFQDLNARIPDGSGWTLESAAAINDRGEIIGKGDHEDRPDAGFLLVPDSAPRGLPR